MRFFRVFKYIIVLLLFIAGQLLYENSKNFLAIKDIEHQIEVERANQIQSIDDSNVISNSVNATNHVQVSIIDFFYLKLFFAQRIALCSAFFL